MRRVIALLVVVTLLVGVAVEPAHAGGAAASVALGLASFAVFTTLVAPLWWYPRPAYAWYPPPAYYAPAPGYYYAPPPPPQPAYAYYPPPPAYALPPAPPVPNYSTANCREYSGTIVIDGQEQRSYGTACLQPDGTWRIVR